MNGNLDANPFIGKIRKFIIKQDGEIVQYLVPVSRNSDDAIGFYDLVSESFFANSGTNAFTGGNEITFDGDEIIKTYCKVSGAWQMLEGTDIEDVNTEGGNYFNPTLLDDFNVDWVDSSTQDAKAYELDIDDCRIAFLTAGSLAILCTDSTIDFSNYTKLKVKVDKSDGTYNTMSRIAVSTSPINNSNRGSDYAVFDDGTGIYELTLPSNKSALYVALECWTYSNLCVSSITAE